MLTKDKLKHIHFVGIKGVAMTALAIVAKEQGFKVTGSDINEDFPTDEVLKKNKINPLIGFRKENLFIKETKNGQTFLRFPDLVIVTGAHGGINNPEAQAARKLKIKVLMHGQVLGEFANKKKCLAIAGNHGKTTVAALVAHLLMKAGFDPSFAVGCGNIKSLGTPAHAGKGEYFLVEADEYATDPGIDPTPRFFWLNPYAAVITNIEYDHPDVYSSIRAVKEAYLTFAKKISNGGFLVAGIDSKNLKEILQKINCQVFTYGFSPTADYQITKVSFGEEQTRYWLKHKEISLGQFTLKIPGKFNALNAVAASIMVSNLGLSWEEIRESLISFQGTKRRFEKISQKNGVVFFDDYAHHPTQIKATLEAVRNWFPKKRIICIFQPHTFSRTKALLEEFSKSFWQADEVVITDIYPSAREKPDTTISSEILVNKILEKHKNVFYIKKIEKVANFLKKHLKDEDIVLTLGAGNIYKLHKVLLNN